LSFDLDFDTSIIKLSIHQLKPGYLKSFLSRPKNLNINQLTANDRNLLFALADLKRVSESYPNELSIDNNSISMSHNILAEIDANTAAALNLPPLVELIFRSDVEGVPGQNQFRLRYDWFQFDQKQVTHRIGALLKTSNGLRRIPKWLLDAIVVADEHEMGSDLQAHWVALAKFRKALEPSFNQLSHTSNAEIEMSAFLSELKVQIADGFSIASTGTETDPEFEVIPFSSRALEDESLNHSDGAVSEIMSELNGQPLLEFQDRVRHKGALSAYRVAFGHFLVVEPSASIALGVMAQMQKATKAEKISFINNPRQKITEAIEADFRKRGVLDGLTPAQEQEALDAAALPVFIETKEYSDRVIGKTIFLPTSDWTNETSGTTWLPEIFGDAVASIINSLPVFQLKDIEEKIQQAIIQGHENIEFEGEIIAATLATKSAIQTQIQKLEKSVEDEETNEIDDQDLVNDKTGPIILDVKENYENVQWHAKIKTRDTPAPKQLPLSIRTKLKEHQLLSFNWQVAAWQSGLPGILNADEPGLGKTLQTLAFLTWLKSNFESNPNNCFGPVLIVAPTSLLENWEQEVQLHLDSVGLGHLIRLFGSGTSARRRAGLDGIDTQDGEEHLDLSALRRAIADGKGHHYWLLTTYTTLTNYQHSIGSIPFSVIVFDEIQALKTPGSLRAKAGLAMKADFRIGLTGTPIENSTTDLWAILEQLVSGRLGPLNEFKKTYGTPDAKALHELYKSIFEVNDELPPIALRRLKSDVARDLPGKVRMLHPKLMSDTQSYAYESARNKLEIGSSGAALKMLHHIRTVSVHPAITDNIDPEEFIALSGRLKSCFEILDEIQKNNERVLVFIEHINMQYRFIELLKWRYGLPQVDLINGSTPLNKRLSIVNHFQRHLVNDEGFDVLVLGPKAAGTGLTLTAATHVIHLSRWWNPAVEEQCNDRIHRIGQTKPVTIHIPMSIHKDYRENSFDCLLHSLMTKKRKLATSALWPMGDTESDSDQLQKMLTKQNKTVHTVNPVHEAITRTFERDHVVLSQPQESKGYYYE
jgi:hypothetical protein